MFEGPNIALVASLIGDPARANMLCALMDGRALTAGELAELAGVTRQTTSSHLARLMEARLLAREIQGRHHYYRLATADVARALEALMTVAATGSGRRVRTGPRDNAMRRARVCYDHLAGELAVELFDGWIADGWIARETGDDGPTPLRLTGLGRDRFSALGIDVPGLERARRATCRSCLDWSERRSHLAGGLGAAVLDLCLARNWIRRPDGGRHLTFTAQGERDLRAALGCLAVPERQADRVGL